MDNPFDFFHLNASLSIDMKHLRQQFLQVQRNAHPDFGDGQTTHSENANIYYEILKEPSSRLKCLVETFSDFSLNVNLLDPDFLMEMMDLNDEIDEAIAGNNTKRLSAENQLNDLKLELDDAMLLLTEKWESGEYAINGSSYEQWSDHALWYQKYKYWLRLRKNLDGVEEM